MGYKRAKANETTKYMERFTNRAHCAILRLNGVF